MSMRVGSFKPVRPLRVVRADWSLDVIDLSRGLSGTPPGPNDGYRELALGEVALRRGALDDEVERLERGIELTWGASALDFYLGSESLATAWQLLRNEPRALRVLENAAKVQARIETALGGAHGRFRVQARLAREYRKLGRIDEAVAIEDEVLHMLTYADADHPVVLAINEARAGLL